MLHSDADHGAGKLLPGDRTVSEPEASTDDV